MKEVVKVSISGISFTFDHDAYEVMKSYLSKLEAGYAKNPDGREIVADIEARIAELILTEQESERIIGHELAESVIAQLGFPDDMDSDEADTVEKLQKRLYRNPEGAVFGGVCSGLGTYFRADPVWVRLILLAPLLLSIITGFFPGTHNPIGSTILVGVMLVLLYVVLWIAIPAARTPRQRLEMRGEKITASSIRQTFSDIHQVFSENASAGNSSPKRQRATDIWADIIYIIGRITLVFAKIIIAFIAFIIGIVAIALLISLVAIAFANDFIGFHIFTDSFAGLEGITPVAYISLIMLAILISMLIVGSVLIRVLLGSKGSNKPFTVTMSVIWTILMVYLIVISIHNRENIRMGARNMLYEIEHYDEADYDLFHNGRWDVDIDDDHHEELIEEYFREYREADWSDPNTHVEIIALENDSLVIHKVVLSPDNLTDTLSNQRIVLKRPKKHHHHRDAHRNVSVKVTPGVESNEATPLQ